MPTENRSSNTEMVSVPRDIAENAWQALDDDGRFEESCPLREALDRPTQLRQGDPVALPARKQPRNSTNADWYGAIGWNACLDEIAKLGPLYTRPAQGEPVAWEMDDTAGESGRILVTNDTRVRDEWVRNELPVAPLFGRADPEPRGAFAKCMEAMADRDAAHKREDALHAQLAERDALLEDWHTANCTGEVNVSDKAYRIVTRTAAMLSANATADLYERADILADAAYRNGVMHGYKLAMEGNEAEYQACINSLTGHLRAARAALSASAEPSAPVERDERADFAKWTHEVIGTHEFEGVHHKVQRRDSMSKDDESMAWGGWQARAALDRKP